MHCTMNQILIALDYNPCAKKVAETGYSLAKAMNAKLAIVHVVADPVTYNLGYLPIMGFYDFTVDSPFRSLADQKIEAQNFLKAVANYFEDDSIEWKVLEGDPSQAVLQYARDHGSDFLVIGTQSYNGFKKPMLGDVSSMIIK